MKIRIERDEDPQSPREDDNVGTMFSFDALHSFGDNDGDRYRVTEGILWEDIEREVVENEGPGFGFALYHDGRAGSIWVDTGPSSGDRHVSGVIYVSAKKAIYEFGADLSAAEMFQRVKSCCEAEVVAYAQYLEGDVWGYVIEDDDGDILESVCGFFGREYCEEEAREALEALEQAAVESKKRTERAVRDATVY